MCANEILRDHLFHYFIRNFFDFLYFVRCPEPIEEMDERNTGFERRRVGNERHIHHFLHVVGRKHGPTGLPGSHDILVVTEDGERLSCDRSSRDVEDRGSCLAGYFVHIWNHEK